MYCANVTLLIKYIDRLDIQTDDQLIILTGYNSEASLGYVFEFLNSKNIQFFGGIFPGLIVGNNNFREGFIIHKVSPLYFSIIRPSMMKMILHKEQLKDSTAIVLVDGLSNLMANLMETLYEKLGSSVNYIGGGAGFYSLDHKPCIFNNLGIYEDVGFVCVIKDKVEIAVEHGWKKLRGPFIVSSSNHNVLNELDSIEAFKVYKEIIEEEESLTLSHEGFFTFAKDHPFGISQEDGSIIVRDPITVTEDDSIVCVADIPVNSKLYILKGDINSLLISSIFIAKAASKTLENDSYQPLLFNCISRAMFLDDRFEEELSNIQKSFTQEVEGALSIGEIASTSTGKLAIHNKSTVLGILKSK